MTILRRNRKVRDRMKMGSLIKNLIESVIGRIIPCFRQVSSDFFNHDSPS
jgi:hypothetical protein